MNLFSALASPLIGGIIGYFTNDLAVKMLFRPYKPLYIGSFHVPFTPGIVPRRLKELAVLLGEEVEARFFNADDLEILFQSEGFSATVAENIVDMLYSKQNTLCYIMEGLELSEKTGPAIRAGKKTIAESILNELREFDFAPVIRRSADEISDRLLRGGANMLNSLAPMLSDGIKAYLRDSGEETLLPLMDEVLVDFGDRRISAILTEAFPERAVAVSLVKDMYLKFMAHYVRSVVESIDVGGMITEKLRTMKPQAVEALILSVVNREFRYVVWLGGLLGAIIGTVNIFI